MKCPILICISNRDVCSSYQEWLSFEGIPSFVCHDDQALFKHLRTASPQLIIVDQSAECEKGCRRVNRIRELAPETRILFIIDYEAIHCLKKYYNDGMSDYLVKPINLVLLSQKIDRLLS